MIQALAKEVIRVLRNQFVAPQSGNLPNDATDFPIRGVSGIVEEDETSWNKEPVAVFEITSRKFVGMVAIDVTKAESAAKPDLPAKDIAMGFSVGPDMKEFIRKRFDRVWQIVDAERAYATNK